MRLELRHMFNGYHLCLIYVDCGLGIFVCVLCVICMLYLYFIGTMHDLSVKYVMYVVFEWLCGFKSFSFYLSHSCSLIYSLWYILSHASYLLVVTHLHPTDAMI